MPVIGHALVGLGTALSTSSARQNPATRPISKASADYWILAMIVLAYLPDIAAQGLHAAGIADVSKITHSLGFAVASAPVAGWLLARARLASLRFAMTMAFLSVSLHIVLDLLQGTDRAVLWPLTAHRMSLGVALVPASLLGEVTIVSIGVALLLAVYRMRGGSLGGLWRPQAVVPAVCVGLIAALALTTHVLRDDRERQLRAAKWLIEKQHAYSLGLQVLDRADRWPSPAKPGRIAYLRAEAFNRLGDRHRAEEHYLQSYAADPTYFWVVADLAIFYASGPEPEAVRRRAAAPYLERLRGRFSRHPELPETLERVQKLLARTAP